MTDTLKLIGTGYGRTGTDSMRTALEILGLGPCHHMRSLFDNPSHKQDWQNCLVSGSMDWDLLLGGFQSCIDWPSANFWPELIDKFPEAKVLLTWRTPERWYASMEKTIIPSVREMLAKGESSPGSLTLLQILDGKPMTKANLIAAYEANTAEVKDTVPAKRLLVYPLGDGWEPLCKFLNVAVPEQAFPRSNNAKEFHNWVKKND